MKKIIIFLGILLLVVGCAAPRVVYVPAESKTIIEYRDSLIHVKDTILVEVPREKIVEVVPELDISRLETSVAISEAFVDTKEKKLRHTLRNKETALKGKLDTIVRVEYVNEYIEVPIIKEVEVEKLYIPKIYKWSLGFSIIVLLVVFGTIIWKLKRWFI